MAPAHADSVAVMVFTRDLRIRDNPALAAAVAEARCVLPLYVMADDPGTQRRPPCPAREAFLAGCLRDLDTDLRARGAGLVVRAGDWVERVLAAAGEVGATRIHLADDGDEVSRQRIARLTAQASAAGIGVHRHPGVTVVPPGILTTATGGGYKVFTPYHRAWTVSAWRPVAATPTRVVLPDGVDVGQGAWLTPRTPAAVEPGGRAGWTRLRQWLDRQGLARYADHQDDLAGDATSRLAPYLAMGCLSPLEVALAVRDLPGAGPYLRQLCWRDFFHQVLAARPDAEWSDYRPGGGRWVRDEEALEAWCAGRTGYPVVDAALHQLAAEGFMHNRARMVVASFLTKDLGLDWRWGARHFLSLLVDGDLACNQLNWQWVAGTGTDPNPHRIFNPTLQGQRFDPHGAYVGRYLPRLAGLPASEVHDPDPATRRARGYPPPLVDHRLAVASYRSRLRAARPPGDGGNDGDSGSP